MAQLARASCARLSWKPRKCASCAKIAPIRWKVFSLPETNTFFNVFDNYLHFCAPQARKNRVPHSQLSFSPYKYAFFHQESQISPTFWGVSGVRELCQILWLAKTRGGARVVPEMTVPANPFQASFFFQLLKISYKSRAQKPHKQRTRTGVLLPPGKSNYTSPGRSEEEAEASYFARTTTGRFAQ